MENMMNSANSIKRYLFAFLREVRVACEPDEEYEETTRKRARLEPTPLDMISVAAGCSMITLTRLNFPHRLPRSRQQNR